MMHDTRHMIQAVGKDRDDVLDKNSFLMRPKAMFSLVTMLAITFGISYALITFQWRERSVGTTVIQGPAPLVLTLTDECTVTFVHVSHTRCPCTQSAASIRPVRVGTFDHTKLAGDPFVLFALLT